ncbi:MAG: response regulator [Proteobacteria bacterium]|nr:response regulator [Pseudomonadota bacterium]
MRTLVVEDDFTSRLVLKEMLKPYGEVHIAVDGKEAVEAFEFSIESKLQYDLICLDIMMPKMDGQSVLKEIRRIEQDQKIPVESRSKVIMTTVLEGKEHVITAFIEQCDGYFVKPIRREKLIQRLQEMELI